MTIHKYPIRITDKQVVTMPAGAEILTAQMQGETLCLWVKVVGVAEVQPRTIEVFGTGARMSDEPRRYIGTVQQFNGALVWHVFELGQAS